MAIIIEIRKFVRNNIFPIIGILLFYTIVFLLGNNTICYFRNIFGMPCPGCGMSRAYRALFNGDLLKALNYHPLFILPIIIFMVVIFKENKLFYKIYRSNIFWSAVCILFIGLWIVRMIMFFPNNEPMIFYKDAVLPRIYRLLRHGLGY